MTPERYQRVREIHHAVCELAGTAQEQELRRRCAGDAELLAEVRSLLDHHDERSAAVFSQSRGIRERLLGSAGDGELGGVPSQIGRYRVLRRLAEGGMGIVFEAEQGHPRRRVALKLIRLGFGSAELLRRFRHEAELLGRLRHPGIAHVYEAGVYDSPTGAAIPYLAMELIDGVPLTEYARRRKLNTRARLALFAKVCDAVEHAHQNGVIHRDLKPGNVLVSDEAAERPAAAGKLRDEGAASDGAAEPQPKILDFGIARATDADVRLTTLQTTPGQLLGTIPYMSPEQAAGNSAALDTRSDVYSLGVMLYELLAGRLPYVLDDRALVDAVRVIQEVEPTRISTLDRTYRGDIDTLLAKALEKDKSRRYGSAAELAADVRRYLADLPLVARPASALYQLRKFARRNRILVGATLACVLLLIVGVIGTSVGLVSAMRANRDLAAALHQTQEQERRARASEARATTELERARQITGLLRWTLRSANPAIAKGRDVSLLRELLENTIARLDSGEVASQPAVAAELRAIVAETYASLGDNAAALRVIEPAIALARAAPPEAAADFHRVRILYGGALGNWGRHAEAAAEFEQCVAAVQRGAVPIDEDVGMLYSQYAAACSALGQPQRALELYALALENYRRFRGENHGNVTATIGNMAGCLADLHRYDEAYAQLLEVLRRYESADPPRILHMSIVESMLADVLLDMDRPAESEARARTALDLGSRVFPLAHQQVGHFWQALGRALRAQSRHAEAADCFARAADIFARAYHDTHSLVGKARVDLGIELAALGRFDEAECELLTARDILCVSTDSTDPALDDCTNALARLRTAWDQRRITEP